MFIKFVVETCRRHVSTNERSIRLRPVCGAMPDERPGESITACEVDGLTRPNDPIVRIGRVPRSLLRKKESRACSGVHTSDSWGHRSRGTFRSTLFPGQDARFALQPCVPYHHLRSIFSRQKSMLSVAPLESSSGAFHLHGHASKRL